MPQPGTAVPTAHNNHTLLTFPSARSNTEIRASKSATTPAHAAPGFAGVGAAVGTDAAGTGVGSGAGAAVGSGAGTGVGAGAGALALLRDTLLS